MAFIISCKETQKRIFSFIQNELEDSETEEFIDHVYNCSDCKEEYDVYYTLTTGMRMLEEEKSNEKSHLDSDENLKMVEERMVREKMRFLRRRILLAAIIFLFAILLK